MLGVLQFRSEQLMLFVVFVVFCLFPWDLTRSHRRFIKTFSNPNLNQEQVLDLNDYDSIEFEQLLSFVSYIFINSFKLKKNISLKHKDKIFHLTDEKSSLNNILKYLSNVQN